LKIEIIIAPLVVFLVTVTLLITARFYDHLPMKLPECSFKKLTGLPCVACRGTRSLRSLASGEVTKAVKFNPLAVLGCGFAVAWLGEYLIRKGNPPNRTFSTRSVAVVTLVLLILNWIYLILTDQRFS
jgi:hypothetical protein